ncbi:HlyD family secretion protein [Labilithrix luteola]|nr:hypothetical protein [Labilithrix luteola]
MRLQRQAFLVLLLVGLVTAWVTWLVEGSIALYVRSDRGRLEVSQSAIVVNAPVEGVVVECALPLGRHVAEGDFLIRLDARTFELQAAEKRAEVASCKAALAGLQRQLASEKAARDAVVELVSQTARTGRARVSAEQQSAEWKRKESDVVLRLREANLASKLEEMKVSSEVNALTMQTALASEQAALDTSTAKTSLRDRDAKITVLERQVVEKENEMALQAAKLSTLEFEVERRSVRATTAGSLIDVVTCTPGMTVMPTSRLATLLPHGEVHMVAFFKPSDSVGRVKRGQTAILRVEAFPWTQYGTLTARVAEVGTEPRDGLVRVEMNVAKQEGIIPSMHGMIATAEVETERLSPGRLLLRLAGQPWTEAPVATESSAPPSPLEAAR